MERRIIKYVVSHVQADGAENWQIYMELPGGMMWAHIIPKDTFEWRAAEYGIDPDDTETLLQMVLHEPHIPDPTLPENFATDAAAARGMTVPSDRGYSLSGGVSSVPVWLYNAPSVNSARLAHMARVEAARKTVEFVVDESDDPLDVIRKEMKSRIDSRMLEAKRTYVHGVRMVETGADVDIRKVDAARRIIMEASNR